MDGNQSGLDASETEPVPPVKKRAAAKFVLIVVASLVVGSVVVLAGSWGLLTIVFGETSRNTGTAAAVATAAAPTVSPSTAPTGSPTVSPTPVATTAAPSPTFKTLAAWFHGGGKTLLDNMRSDNAATQKASKNKDAVGVRDGCTKMLSDAMAAKGFAPIPDEQAQPHWAKALPLMVQGALDCADAIDTAGGESLMTEAVREMTAAIAELNLVVDRVNALLG